jgi:hypothetical protein
MSRFTVLHVLESARGIALRSGRVGGETCAGLICHRIVLASVWEALICGPKRRRRTIVRHL